MIKSLVKHFLDKIRRYLLKDIPNLYDHFLLQKQCEVNSLLLAKQLIHRNKSLSSIDSLTEVEFKVFSQWGEDGIIQYLINSIKINNKVFIEFGVENYLEANTRFLLINDNWKGLIIDSDKNNVSSIKSDPLYWRYDLTAHCDFITRDNINSIFSQNGITGDIGVLSIDIDGNDYWVWEAIDIVSPRIVICEYNSLFGDEHTITIPYNKKFNRTKAHFSNLYFGASLPAICRLAEQKGYDFIGSNSAGSNAFFIRKDLSHRLNILTAKQGYVRTNVRESMDENGSRTYLSSNKGLKIISHLPVVDVCTGKSVVFKKLFQV
jgi:hypothetical protein